MFNVLKQNVYQTYTIQKSKFLTFGFFVQNRDDVKTILNKCKKEYADASHICYAYILNDKTYYYSDNGEPSGCAGLPIFNTIKSKQLNFCLFVVVRYFGGIKFGTSLLRSTFKKITEQTLSLAKVAKASVEDITIVEVPYSLISNTFKTFNSEIYKKDYQKDFVILSLVGNHEKIKNNLENLHLKAKTVLKQQIVQVNH